jgi:hypothetical protein
MITVPPPNDVGSTETAFGVMTAEMLIGAGGRGLFAKSLLLPQAARTAAAAISSSAVL